MRPAEHQSLTNWDSDIITVLDALTGLDVTVCIDGELLVEYEDDEQEEVKPGHIGEWRVARTISQYITFESGNEFSIHMTVDRSFNMDSSGLSFFISIVPLEGKQRRSGAS